jgi:hypothetical protein
MLVALACVLLNCYHLQEFYLPRAVLPFADAAVTTQVVSLTNPPHHYRRLCSLFYCHLGTGRPHRDANQLKLLRC